MQQGGWIPVAKLLIPSPTHRKGKSSKEAASIQADLGCKWGKKHTCVQQPTLKDQAPAAPLFSAT